MSVEVAPKFAENLKVGFTQPFEFNDPFELRPMLDFVGTANDVRGVVEATNAEKAATQIPKQHTYRRGRISLRLAKLSSHPNLFCLQNGL
jgi:hypothetical protein